jgi:hypothetical protein
MQDSIDQFFGSHRIRAFGPAPLPYHLFYNTGLRICLYVLTNLKWPELFLATLDRCPSGYQKLRTRRKV